MLPCAPHQPNTCSVTKLHCCLLRRSPPSYRAPAVIDHCLRSPSVNLFSLFCFFVLWSWGASYGPGFCDRDARCNGISLWRHATTRFTMVPINRGEGSLSWVASCCSSARCGTKGCQGIPRQANEKDGYLALKSMKSSKKFQEMLPWQRALEACKIWGLGSKTKVANLVASGALFQILEKEN